MWSVDVDKYCRDMIRQMTVQNRLTWRRHAEALAKPLVTITSNDDDGDDDDDVENDDDDDDVWFCKIPVMSKSAVTTNSVG